MKKVAIVIPRLIDFKYRFLSLILSFFIPITSSRPRNHVIFRCIAIFRRNVIILIILLLPSISLADKLVINGLERNYIIHLPSEYSKDISYPMVVLLHGKNLSANNMMAISGLNTTADTHSFIAVYPEGRNKAWNYNSSPQGYDDIDFIKALLEKLKAEYSIDKSKIYLAGFSNGGFMTQRILCEGGQLFAAFASVSAQVFSTLPGYCTQVESGSILLIHGTADNILPFNGIASANGPRLPSVTASFEFWLQYLSCSVDIKGSDIASIDEETRVTLFEGQDCINNQEVNLYAIVNGGHNWPGHSGFIPFSIAGHSTKDIDANEVLWEFFSRHSLAK